MGNLCCAACTAQHGDDNHPPAAAAQKKTKGSGLLIPTHRTQHKVNHSSNSVLTQRETTTPPLESSAAGGPLDGTCSSFAGYVSSAAEGGFSHVADTASATEAQAAAPPLLLIGDGRDAQQASLASQFEGSSLWNLPVVSNVYHPPTARSSGRPPTGEGRLPKIAAQRILGAAADTRDFYSAQSSPSYQGILRQQLPLGFEISNCCLLDDDADDPRELNGGESGTVAPAALIDHLQLTRPDTEEQKRCLSYADPYASESCAASDVSDMLEGSDMAESFDVPKQVDATPLDPAAVCLGRRRAPPPSLNVRVAAAEQQKQLLLLEKPGCYAASIFCSSSPRGVATRCPPLTARLATGRCRQSALAPAPTAAEQQTPHHAVLPDRAATHRLCPRSKTDRHDSDSSSSGTEPEKTLRAASPTLCCDGHDTRPLSPPPTVLPPSLSPPALSPSLSPPALSPSLPPVVTTMGHHVTGTLGRVPSGMPFRGPASMARTASEMSTQPPAASLGPVVTLGQVVSEPEMLPVLLGPEALPDFSAVPPRHRSLAITCVSSSSSGLTSSSSSPLLAPVARTGSLRPKKPHGAGNHHHKRRRPTVEDDPVKTTTKKRCSAGPAAGPFKKKERRRFYPRGSSGKPGDNDNGLTGSVGTPLPLKKHSAARRQSSSSEIAMVAIPAAGTNNAAACLLRDPVTDASATIAGAAAANSRHSHPLFKSRHLNNGGAGGFDAHIIILTQGQQCPKDRKDGRNRQSGDTAVIAVVPNQPSYPEPRLLPGPQQLPAPAVPRGESDESKATAPPLSRRATPRSNKEALFANLGLKLPRGLTAPDGFLGPLTERCRSHKSIFTMGLQTDRNGGGGTTRRVVETSRGSIVGTCATTRGPEDRRPATSRVT